VHVVKTPDSARAFARSLPRPLGLVPTMGALHAGHRSLIERAAAENASVAGSLFVNPLQFGPHEDFGRYPRAFADDLAQFEAGGAAVLYAPAVETMYPPGFATTLDTGELGRTFEGASRPGHFNGVATVVLKLLHALEPSALYLGQKDAQQCAVLRALVRDLDLPVRVVVHPTVREPDGLALSSRNVYLTPEQRAAAPSFARALQATAAALRADRLGIAEAKARGARLLEAPLVWEYLEVVDPLTFVPLSAARGAALVIGATRAGSTRLLDNVSLAAPDGLDPLLTPAAPLAAARR
jgi:pantoate--beta-alanine ligase